MAELATDLAASYPERFREKQRSLGGPNELIAQLTREIYAQRGTIQQKHPEIVSDASQRPMRIFIDAIASKPILAQGQVRTPVDEPDKLVTAPAPGLTEILSDDIVEDQSEQSLYAPLQAYLWEGLGILTKRIREGTSSNRRGRNGNKWLHPDIVGMNAPGHDWLDLVRQCSMALPARKAELIGLEVKLQLTAGSLRESFFQSVSNSLWANKAYLAAVEVKGEDTFNELTMLCSLHGVGYIAIDPHTYTDSRVLIPAREREEVDWASVNRIATENKDFKDFLKNVLNYLQTGQLMPKLWDGVS